MMRIFAEMHHHFGTTITAQTIKLRIPHPSIAFPFHARWSVGMPDAVMSPFYHLFFLYIEPISAILGSYVAHCLPSTYLLLTNPNSAPFPDATLPIATTVTLSQLANLYFLFALNEGLAGPS